MEGHKERSSEQKRKRVTDLTKLNNSLEMGKNLLVTGEKC